MSKMGKALIDAIEEATVKGLVTLQISPDVADLRKRLKLSQKHRKRDCKRHFLTRPRQTEEQQGKIGILPLRVYILANCAEKCNVTSGLQTRSQPDLQIKSWRGAV